MLTRALLCDSCVSLCLQQRAFLMARQREREGRGRGSPGARGGYDGYESEDSMDSFIDDGEEEDWRVAMRQITGEDCWSFVLQSCTGVGCGVVR
jgi:hypothetical protein